MDLVLETRGKQQQVDVHYVNAPVSCVVEEDFVPLPEVLQEQVCCQFQFCIDGCVEYSDLKAIELFLVSDMILYRKPCMSPLKEKLMWPELHPVVTQDRILAIGKAREKVVLLKQ